MYEPINRIKTIQKKILMIENIINEFDSKIFKGLYDVRNFIAHDYDGVDLSIIEDVIRYGIPSLKNSIDKI